jgi:anti-sigma regulatory factor (Ser/Thr protein kinase)
LTARPPGYRHEAFPYAGHAEFVRSSAEFLRAGLRNDERAILVSVADKVADVRDELGPDGDLVTFVDMDSVGRNPSRIISVFQRFLAEQPGRPARGLGEPIYPGRSDEALVEAQLHELLLNSTIGDGWDFWLGCPYDTAELGADVLAEMRASHPYTAGTAEQEFMAGVRTDEMFATALPSAPSDARVHTVDVADLAGARRFLRTVAAELGLMDTRADDLIYAVNEVVTNSVRHGDGHPVLAVWTDPDRLVCDVRDGGWIRDSLVGRLAPPTSDTGGRGLWLVHNLCDLVQVRSAPWGTSVRMYLDY